MGKIILIIQREYLTRVKKKSFILMTILTPMLVAGFYGLIALIVLNNDVGDAPKKVVVSDPSGLILPRLQNDEKITFVQTNLGENELKQKVKEEEFDALLLIPQSDSIQNIREIQVLASKQPGLGLIKSIEQKTEAIQSEAKMAMMNLTRMQIESTRGNIKIKAQRIKESRVEDGSTQASSMAGYITSLLLYIFIFIYGVQVMRGVIEEKTNRIVEVLISSVRPFQLMMGKIIGITLVALTQFALWIILSLVNISFVGGLQNQNASAPTQTIEQAGQDTDMGEIISQVMTLNFPLILGCFLFFFITGFLFYGAFFAAIGSLVDNETDTQQFMWPVSIPLILGLVVAESLVWSNPDHPVLNILSFIPFTAPVVMMVRVPFMDNFADNWLALSGSMVMMMIGFIFAVWFASKIYRTGILMYGKKPSFKEIGKWLLYRG